GRGRTPAVSRGCRREEGGVCGRRVPSAFERQTQQDFPPPFPQRSSRISSTLDNAPTGEILKALGVTHVLDTVPACKNLYKNSFTYHCFQADKILQFDNVIQF
ncbi:unnamed protein product, partial [Musa acuminata subsp. burmannicoides]